MLKFTILPLDLESQSVDLHLTETEITCGFVVYELTLLGPALERDIVLVDLVLQGHDFVALILDLLNVLLFSDSLLLNSIRIQLHKTLKILTLRLYVLHHLQHRKLLCLLHLDASLSFPDLFLDLRKINLRWHSVQRLSRSTTEHRS